MAGHTRKTERLFLWVHPATGSAQPARETPQARVIDRTAGQEKDREVADVDDVLQIPFL